MVEPSAGKIILDGIDLLSLPLSILRNSIAIVPQVLSLCHYPIMSTGSDIESLIFDP
jgi:ABC-type multidrug transport system fused ATPase/permease subunit